MYARGTTQPTSANLSLSVTQFCIDSCPAFDEPAPIQAELSVGQSTVMGQYTVTLSSLTSTSATFAVALTSTPTPPPSPPSFSASPTSGRAPFIVTFTALVGGSIDFGDGSSGTMVNNDAAYVASHTYTSPGTYTAQLDTSPTCPANAMCAPLALPPVTVTVGSAIGSCPMYTMAICPAGTSRGPSSVDSNGCTVPGSCVPGTETCPQLIVDCIAGYHPVNGAPDANGCYTNKACVPNTTTTCAPGMRQNVDGTCTGGSNSGAYDPNANLANAFTALENALEAFLQGVGR
jgi:hypothetical protein